MFIWKTCLAEGFQREAATPAEYSRHARLWKIFGTIAPLLPLAKLYFMVFEPL
jgi:hypothetical protein